MKRLSLLCLVLALVALCTSCQSAPDGEAPVTTMPETLKVSESEIYDGYFEEETVDVTVECISGSAGCYTLEGNKLTFTALTEDSVYSIKGTLSGNIVIDVGEERKLDLELHGLSLVGKSESPITVLSGDKVTITAKKDFTSYIYDMRTAVDENDENAHSGAIYSTVDLEIAGKGTLNVVSENNNGIHTKDDLEVKNLTLNVMCLDNALKGNDSVTIESGTTSLIAKQGDGIKTTNTDVSDKGKQRGTVSITGGTHTIGAACDGIDAAYDVVIDGEATSLSVYTDKYSSASEEVTATADGKYYLRTTQTGYKYSVKYYNSDSDVLWINVSDSYETVSSGGKGRPGRPSASQTTFYYYEFEKKASYQKFAIYMYEKTQEQGQDSNYYACSSYKSHNDSYDTVAIDVGYGGALSVSFTNYTTQQGGMGRPGGMGGGNTEKGDHSTKGIKAGNAITVNAGSVNIKAYDDAIHANADGTLENGAAPLGNVNINGGTLSLYSNDDGIHADGVLAVNGGSVTVTNSYEGLEGTSIKVTSGKVAVTSSDDGFNSTATSGTGISILGGSVYVFARGDGLDSNSRSSYSGIVFSGGEAIVISNSNGNSAIDSESGYKYSGGAVVAVMPRGGMSGESTKCQNFSAVGMTKSMSLSSGATLTASIKGTTLSVVMPCSVSSATVIVLGDSSATLSAS